MDNANIIEKKDHNIVTPRLTLRILTTELISDKYVEWLNDPQVNRFLETRFSQQTLDTCSSFVSSAYVSESEFLFGIFLQENNEHIGNIKLGSVNWHHLTGQISLFIGECSHWGKGYATEAIKALSRWACTEVGIQKLEAGCYEENLGSLRAFLRVGYQVEGFRRQHVLDRTLRRGIFLLGALPAEIEGILIK